MGHVRTSGRLNVNLTRIKPGHGRKTLVCWVPWRLGVPFQAGFIFNECSMRHRDWAPSRDRLIYRHRMVEESKKDPNLKAVWRLDGWKEIAAHLGKGRRKTPDPRTVRRWERVHGMPVHREGSSVFALTDELNLWRLSRIRKTSPVIPPELDSETSTDPESSFPTSVKPDADADVPAAQSTGNFSACAAS
jgi:hypothetical protein